MIECLPGLMRWWIGTAVGGGTLLAVACLAQRYLRRPAYRQRFGESAVAAALVLAALRFAPAWIELPVPSNSAPPPAESAVRPGPVWVEVEEIGPSELVIGEPTTASPIEAESATRPEVVPLLLAAYGLVAAGLFARWLLGQWQLGRILRTSRPAGVRLTHLLRSLPHSGGVRLRLSDRVAGPVCWGLWKPTIVLPGELADRADDTTLKWVLTHELTHLNRSDPWSSWLLGLASAVYFFVPWFWWLRRQIRLCQEYVADAAAAAQSDWPDEYAAFLLAYAKAPAAPLGATAAWGRTSDLLRRVTMVLQTSTGSIDCPRRWARITAGTMLALAVVLAGVGVRADEPKPEPAKEADQIRVEILAGPESTSEDGGPADAKQRRVITINGQKIEVPLTAEQAERLEKQIQEALGKGNRFFLFDARQSAEDQKKAVEQARRQAHEAMKQAQEMSKQAAQIAEQIQMQMEAALRADGGVKPEEIQKLLADMLKDANVEMDVRIDGAWPGGFPMGIAGRGESRLGVRVEKPSEAIRDQLDLPKDQGLVVREVIADSAAAKAGFKVNDIVLEFDGATVPDDSVAFAQMVSGVEAGKSVEAVVLRKGKKETVRIAELPAAKQRLRVLAVPPAEGARILSGPFGKQRLDVLQLPELTGKGVSRSVTVQNGNVTIREAEGDLTVLITGTAQDDGRLSIESIVVNDGGKKVVTDSIDNLPEKYRARVRELTSGKTLQWKFERSK